MGKPESASEGAAGDGPTPGASHGPREDADLRLLADSARDFAMIFINAERKIVRWSMGAQHVLGWTEKEAIGKSDRDIFYTPEDRAAGVPQWEQGTALRDGRAEDERWHLKKDGTRFWASGVLVPLYDPATNALRGFGKVLRDQTPQKRLEDELRASEARLAAIFTRAAVGLCEISLDGRFLQVNDELCRILGRTREELLASGVPGVTHLEDRAASRHALTCVLETGEPISFDKRYLRPDGAVVWANSSLSLLRDERGEPRAVLAVTADLSERKRAEEALLASERALRDANETLESRVTQRTESLTAALGALEASLAERERTEAARRDLTRRVVLAQEEERRRISRELHDQMGQHLTGFGLGLKALEGAVTSYCPASAGAERLLERLRTITEELGRDVHRLAVELRPTALDDLGLVRVLEAYVAEWAQRAGVTAGFEAIGLLDGPRRLPPLVETTVYRVTQEALTNAAKYAVPSGATRVSVTLLHLEGYLQATVEDDGPGFDTEAAAQKGRLGLEGMRERAELAGGTLEIESSPGQGATVFLRVPVSGISAGPAEAEARFRN